jgi:hypothetical protein
MVRPLILAFAASLLLADVAKAELVLTPTVDEYVLDGAKLKQLAFFDGGQKVTYQSPHGWDYSGSATQLTLHPPGKPQAVATITRVSHPEPIRFDDETLKKLVDEAVTLVPKDSTNVGVESQEKAPLRIGRRDTFLLVLSYSLLGQTYNRSILFINRDNGEQIRCQLTCSAADFKNLQKAFLGSQYTWRNL